MTKDSLINELREIGIKEGDVIFVTIDILKVGYYNKTRDKTLNDWVEIFKSIVGETGAVLFASYTKGFFRFSKKEIIFNRFSHTYAGSLPNFIVSDSSALRSSHPTNSVIGFGNILKDHLLKHNSRSLSYSIMGDLIKMPNSKFIMIGTIDKKNAPQAMHYVQEELGFTKVSPFKYLMQTYYEENGNKLLYTKIDFGGCSAGGYRLFAPLLVNNAVKLSYVGKTIAACMPALKSYEIIKEELVKNRRIIQCDNKNCIDCYGNPCYNGFGVIIFYIKLLLNFKTRVWDRLGNEK